jgi:hypothetical protein
MVRLSRTAAKSARGADWTLELLNACGRRDGRAAAAVLIRPWNVPLSEGPTIRTELPVNTSAFEHE